MDKIFQLVMVLICCVLTGCGVSKNTAAVDACDKVIIEKLSGKTFTYSKTDMLASAKTDGEGILSMRSEVIFDQGLPAESKQLVDCRVQFDPANKSPPSVIQVQFTW